METLSQFYSNLIVTNNLTPRIFGALPLSISITTIEGNQMQQLSSVCSQGTQQPKRIISIIIHQLRNSLSPSASPLRNKNHIFLNLIREGRTYLKIRTTIFLFDLPSSVPRVSQDFDHHPSMHYAPKPNESFIPNVAPSHLTPTLGSPMSIPLPHVTEVYDSMRFTKVYLR